jgi:DNA-binding NarL/FixJ family response regulator
MGYEADTSSAIRMIVVDDHYVTRAGLRLILARFPRLELVGEAENGRQALEMAAELKPDVMLMDVSMPEMDGIEASRAIKEISPETRIIMLSSNEHEEAICACLAAGASGYCLKDAHPDRLYAAIQGVFKGDIWLDSAIAAKVLKVYFASEPETTAPSPQKISGGNFKAGATHERAPKTPRLSERESAVLNLLVQGLSNLEIAQRLVISLPTAKSHVRSILNKLAVDDRTQAAIEAMHRGLV